MKKIGFIHAGSFYHLACLVDPALRAWNVQDCYAPELGDGELFGFDALLLADRQHPDTMKKLAPQLLDYLSLKGRRLYIGGENQVDRWLPGVRAEARETNYWSWRTGEDAGQRVRNADHFMWDYFSQESLVWHYHGVLFPPPGAVSLAGLEEGLDNEGSLLYYDGQSHQAELVATTMDPTYHHGSGFMIGATQLLYRVVRWLAAADAPRQGSPTPCFTSPSSAESPA